MICVDFASMAFSISSFRVLGMSRMSWPLEILCTVSTLSFVIIVGGEALREGKCEANIKQMISKVRDDSANLIKLRRPQVALHTESLGPI